MCCVDCSCGTLWQRCLQTSFHSRVNNDNSVLCVKVIVGVFSSPEQVMGKLVSKVFQTKLSEHVNNKLKEHRNTDPEK